MIIFLGPSLVARAPITPALISIGWNTVIVCRECGDWAKVIPFPEGGKWEARSSNCLRHPHPYLGKGSIVDVWKSYTIGGRPIVEDLWLWATNHPKLLRHEFSVLMAEAGFPLDATPTGGRTFVPGEGARS